MLRTFKPCKTFASTKFLYACTVGCKPTHLILVYLAQVSHGPMVSFMMVTGVAASVRAHAKTYDEDNVLVLG
jgi:hypothetical protein